MENSDNQNSDPATETTTQPVVDEQDQELDPKEELKVLKVRADMIGVKYSNNIKVETLREKIKDKTESSDEQEPETGEKHTGESDSGQDAPVNALAAALEEDDPSKVDFSTWSKKNRESYAREHGRKEGLKLVRIRLANLDPKKKDIPGEIITTGNRFIGTVRKFVPFGEATDEGYHVPNCIYQILKARKFLQISTKRNRKTGSNTTTTRWVKEFSIEVLPPLNKEELEKLAAEQRATGRLGSDGP